jgi:hypothetical protein
MEFKINEARIEIIDENPVYVLPKGTMIYFGSKKDKINDKITFFGFKQPVAEKYGNIIHKFVTTRDLNLLSFMDVNETHQIYKDADDDMKKLLGSNFSIEINGNKIRRSTSESDRKIMEYLCETKEVHGCDGYAMNSNYLEDNSKMKTNFHAEMVLCPPINDVLEERGYELVRSESPPRVSKRKGRRPEYSLSSDMEGFNFGNSPSKTRKMSTFNSPSKTRKMSTFNSPTNPNPLNMRYSYNSSQGSPAKSMSIFGFSSPPSTHVGVRGGKKKRTRKNKKSRKVKRKTKINKKSKKN